MRSVPLTYTFERRERHSDHVHCRAHTFGESEPKPFGQVVERYHHSVFEGLRRDAERRARSSCQRPNPLICGARHAGCATCDDNAIATVARGNILTALGNHASPRVASYTIRALKCRCNAMNVVRPPCRLREQIQFVLRPDRRIPSLEPESLPERHEVPRIDRDARGV